MITIPNINTKKTHTHIQRKNYRELDRQTDRDKKTKINIWGHTNTHTLKHRDKNTLIHRKIDSHTHTVSHTHKERPREWRRRKPIPIHTERKSQTSAQRARHRQTGTQIQTKTLAKTHPPTNPPLHKKKQFPLPRRLEGRKTEKWK